MIALDTHVLVRFLVQDDSVQAKAAVEVIGQLTEANQGCICREVLVELVWVLERSYGYSRVEIGSVLDGLFSSVELVLEAADDLGSLIELYRIGGYGFADLMIVAAGRRMGATEMITFDRKAARLEHVRLLGS